MLEKNPTLVSVICATLGPLNEVAALIRSVKKSVEVANSDAYVEFILVDQSLDFEEFSIDECDRFKLVHIRNSTRGLSRNRNVGLNRASGDWVMFLDSDCLMPEDYFLNFLILKNTNPTFNHFMGRILEPIYLAPLFRAWPGSSKSMSKFMLWYYATSVNNIYKLNICSLRFDERFGLGAKYGSSEDIDFFLRLESKCLYDPGLVIFHPDIFKSQISTDKRNSYSYGFGALCAKHIFPAGALVLFASLLKKLIDVFLRRSTCGDLMGGAIYRLKGFLAYSYNKCKSYCKGVNV